MTGRRGAAERRFDGRVGTFAERPEQSRWLRFGRVGWGLAGSGQAQQVVPILGAEGAEALQAGMLAEQGAGGLVASGIGVVAAQQREVLAGVEPAGQASSCAGGGSDEAVGGQAGCGQQDGGEGIHRTLDDQDGGGRGGPGRQPEAAAVAAGAGGEALEGGAIGERADANEFGTGGRGGAVTAGKDGIAATVGEEGAGAPAAFQQGGVEAAGLDQEVAHGGPERVDGVGQAQGGGGRSQRGGRDGRERLVGEEVDGLAEAAAVGVHDEINGTAAAAATGVVEELGPADAEHRAVAPPALAMARVAHVAEPRGERLEGAVADTVCVCAQAVPGQASHGRSSSQARRTCSALTKRAFSRAAATSA